MNKAFMTYREECERLREELQAAREEIELNEINLGLAVDYQKQLISDFHAERTELKQQLAARDLVIKQMREAVSKGHLALIYQIGGTYKEGYGGSAKDKEAANAMYEALAIQPSTEALDAYVQKAIEHSTVMRAARLLYSWASNWNSEFMNDPDWINEDGPLVRKALNISTV